MSDTKRRWRVASAVVSVQVWFAQDETLVRPGASASLSLAIENVSDRTETYTVIPAGLTASWTTVTRPNVTLFGGSRDVIEVVVRPPAIHTTSAGPTSLAVRVIPQSRPDDAIVAEAIVGVLGFDDRRITMLQPLQRGRHRATFEFMVENHGNSLASCRLHLVDASGRVDGSFDPPAVGVAPGSSSLVRLKLRARRSYFRRAERQLDFEVEATEPDHDPVAGRATLIQPPTVPAARPPRRSPRWPWWQRSWLAWSAVVKPTIEQAAEDAVDDQIDEIVVPDSVAPAPTVTTQPPEPDQPDTPAEVVGEPVSYRLAVDVGVTQERSESIAVPPASDFHMTDLVLQNPNGDLGTAQLLQNSNVLYTWDLAEMNSANEFQPRVSPLPFNAGDNIVLSVSCEGAGQPEGTGCEIAVLLGGMLVPTAEG